LPARLPAGTLPTFAAWQAGCKENAGGTTTLHDVWGMMLGALPCENAGQWQAVLGSAAAVHFMRAVCTALNCWH
jgi:hypothetical protein